MLAFIGFLVVAAFFLFLVGLLVVNVANISFAETFDLGPCGELDVEVSGETPFKFEWTKSGEA